MDANPAALAIASCNRVFKSIESFRDTSCPRIQGIPVGHSFSKKKFKRQSSVFLIDDLSDEEEDIRLKNKVDIESISVPVIGMSRTMEANAHSESRFV